MADVTADKLVRIYIKLRDERKKLFNAYEAEENVLKAQQELISDKLLEICKDVGLDSLKTQYGTASRSVKSRYWTSDWDSLYAFIKEHDAFYLLAQSIHQSNLKSFLEEHPDLLPPGLNSDSKYAISVRKK